MTCTKQEICIHKEYCQRHIGQNLNGCILFSRNGKPLTNEEWLRQATTEQLANTIFSAFVESATMIGCCVTLERFRTQMELTDALCEWLKQPHTEKE